MVYINKCVYSIFDADHLLINKKTNVTSIPAYGKEAAAGDGSEECIGWTPS
jgi:hypothetical protein